MQKLFLPLLLVIAVITQSKAQQRLFDQPVQLKSCNISIDANPFIATTVVEMEFYNSKDQEVEAYQFFQLNRGQVITDFQLELNGKYRAGSIEEKWKARAAYRTIVGKRIDPAILQMDGNNYYSLNIYPVAAKSSRKIKFTITQLMTEENLKLSYTLPLTFKSVTNNFKLNIHVRKPASIPNAGSGLLQDQLFNLNSEEAVLLWQANDIVLNKPITFSIPQFTNQPQFCVNKQNGQTNFLMRLYPEAPRYYAHKPKSINVYWDVSLSGLQRNLVKEIDFLGSYISENEINKTTIFLFNHQMQGIIIFNRGKDNFNSIRNYLLSYKYAGATDLGNLNFSNVQADAVLLFSDGKNSVGNALPKSGAVQVNCITTVYNNNYIHYRKIIGNTGGTIINLNNMEVKQAVQKIDSAENFLFKYTLSNIRINEPLPIKLGSSILLSGTMNQADNLELFYGNNTSTYKSENYFISDNQVCDAVTYKQIRMLKTYDSLMYSSPNHYWHWQDMIIFGLTERVVTPQTSYLVLERIEDYIKYKIAPPKELEQQCAEMNYVYRSEHKIKALKQFTEQEALEAVVKNYNKRIGWWNKDEPLIDLNGAVALQLSESNKTTTTGNTNISGRVSGVQVGFSEGGEGLKEVVVTSAFGIKRTARSTSSYVQHITTAQANTIRQVNVNNALAGKIAGAQVRSQSYAKLGAETSIRLRGENGIGAGSGALYVIDGTIMPSSADINPDDVEDYTILQGPSAAALFGPDGANGAIVMTSKKAKRDYSRSYWGEYKLSDARDEDYVKEMKTTAANELWDTYLRLEKENMMNVGFYFEMANFFFEKGQTDKAQEIMYNAIELCHGSTEGLKLAAYLYERWKYFDKAIAVYKGILGRDANNLSVKRDLALAHFQNEEAEAAVKTYYAIITAAVEENENGNVKENALAEMNAILVLHKTQFDISYINTNLVKVLPLDLRITLESNHEYIGKTQFIEPDNSKCTYVNPNTKNGGRCNNNYPYYHNNSINEYAIKNAGAGNYRIKVDAYDNGYYPGTIPRFVRVITFKNFHKANMSMEVSMFDLDNQYGVIELDEVKW